MEKGISLLTRGGNEVTNYNTPETCLKYARVAATGTTVSHIDKNFARAEKKFQRSPPSTVLAERFSLCNYLKRWRHEMKNLIYTLMLLTLIFPAAARSQTRDCACESQVLPETLALVNGVKIPSSDIKKSTGDQVAQLQQQVVDARQR